MSINPLIVEAWRGTGTYGRAQQAYLGYLCVQAAVLFLWWPKTDVWQALERHDRPDPLIAVLIALGAGLAYHALRSGAEEILSHGQYPVREWAGTDLALPRLLGGYLAAQGVQSAHALALSAPLVLAAFTVGGGTWAALGGSVLAAFVLAMLCRLAGACIYLAIGHYGSETFVVIRVVFVAGYIAASYGFPPASHLMLVYHLVRGVPLTPDWGVPPLAAFVVVHGVGCALLSWVLYHQLARYRASLTAGQDRRE